MMKAFILVLVIFTDDGDMLAKLQPVATAEACVASGESVVKDVQGRAIPSRDPGHTRLILDAQYFCFPVEQQRHA